MEKKEGVEKDGTEKAKRADRREGGEGEVKLERAE